VAIGRALLSQPRLLLMDEPLAGLDPASKAGIAPYLERLHRALSIPVLYVSHDLAEVARLAQHVLVMSEGRVVETRLDAKRAADQAALALAALTADEVHSLALAALRAGLTP
jgi:ABC-type molybdate transport system ATPase subunit